MCDVDQGAVRSAREGLGSNAAWTNEDALAVAIGGPSSSWLVEALQHAQRDPLQAALDAAALWNVLRDRAIAHLEQPWSRIE
jgi:hypothetical protein